MPFPKQDPRPYTQAGIESIALAQKGVYGLFQIVPKGWAWVYIGRARDIRKRLLEHLHSDGSRNPDKCIQQYLPTHFAAAVTDDYEGREKQLIEEYTPPCNQRVG